MQLWWEQPDRKLKLTVFDTFDGVQTLLREGVADLIGNQFFVVTHD